MNYLNSKTILGVKTIVPNFRELIVNGLPEGFNAKGLQPVAKQPIFVWDYTSFLVSVDKEGLIDSVHDYLKGRVIAGLAPFNDFFLVDSSRASVVDVIRVIANKDNLTLHCFLYVKSTEEWIVSGVYKLNNKNEFKFDPKWAQTDRGKGLRPLLVNSESKAVIAKITTFFYAINNYEREVKETTISLKAKPSLRRKEWTGTVTETLITLKPKRVTYVSKKEIDPDHVPEPRIEHERMSHNRRYRSGKVVRVKATTINKGSIKGKRNTTYKVEV